MPNILVIEDDLDIRQPLVQMLMKDGHKVRVAGDGVEAAGLFLALAAPTPM